MATLTKEQRRARITELVGDVALTREEIVEKVVEESGVTEKTVNADVDEMYPDGLPDITGEDDEEDGDGVKEEDDKTGESSTPVGDSLIAVPKTRADFVPEVEIGRIKPEDYTVPEGEEGIVHVQAERTNFNAVTGKKKSLPEIIKVNSRQWPLWKTQIVGLGYSWMVVLHAPEGVDVSHNVTAPASAQ